MDLETLDTHYYCGELNRLTTQDEERAKLEAVENSALVCSIYSAGVPLYSKQALQDILTQLQSDSDNVNVRAIDGRLVSF